MLIKTEGIVLSSLKYGEADLIVKCFTKKYGLKSYWLPNILKAKKAKIRASSFQPLAQLHIEAFHKDKGGLERIKDVKLAYPFKSMHLDVKKGAIVFFIADVLRYAIQEEEENSLLFDFLQNSIQWLDTANYAPNFHLLFLVKLTKYLGFYPDIQSLNLDYFNLLEGTFENNDTNIHCTSGPEVTSLKQLLGTEFDELVHIKSNQEQRADVLTMLLRYYQLHLHGFKKPKSLAVLNAIFS